jgi:hypothetical protein
MPLCALQPQRSPTFRNQNLGLISAGKHSLNLICSVKRRQTCHAYKYVRGIIRSHEIVGQKSPQAPKSLKVLTKIQFQEKKWAEECSFKLQVVIVIRTFQSLSHTRQIRHARTRVIRYISTCIVVDWIVAPRPCSCHGVDVCESMG